MSTGDFKTRLHAEGARVDKYLATCLDQRALPERLQSAMYYSLMAGGKRVRPVLCLSTAAMCGLPVDAVLPFACAIEMIHTYSLIHDDLPAMDDDDLRRGKPSNHKAFDEATAILAGDALLTDAFCFMTSVELPAARVLAALGTVAQAAGGSGMVAGQMLDMLYTGVGRVELEKLQHMHALKTGALLRASCISGAQLAGAGSGQLEAISQYGASLGVAFQIADDILDITADTVTLGKPAGSDQEQGKNTYPALVGLDQSRALANTHMLHAVECLNNFSGSEAAFLRALARYVVERSC
ncbi:MAG: polyprenyl synthetase family protein [Desulfovibrionaceae bacterium]